MRSAGGVLKYALVNDFNTNEVFEITRDEMFTLSQGLTIFMCMKDTERLSNASPMGVMAFHPFSEDEDAWSKMCAAIVEYRKINGTPAPQKEPLLTKDGKVLMIAAVAPPDLRQN
jgi:hypothetical protein